MSLIPWRRTVPTAARLQASHWLPSLIGLTVLAATLGLWHLLNTQERLQIASRVALHLESVKNEITVRLESRVLALVRMAHRWEAAGQPRQAEWETDAQLYLRHYAGYLAIAWLDPRLQSRWQMPAETSGSATFPPLPEGVRMALEAARHRRQATLTPVFEWPTGEPALGINAPIFGQDEFAGFIVGVFQVQSLLDDLLRKDIAPGYGIRLTEGGQMVYHRGPPVTAALARWSQTAEVNLPDRTWRVQLWPLPEELAVIHSDLPLAVLVSGLTVALLLGFTVHWVQVARSRTRQAEQANHELANSQALAAMGQAAALIAHDLRNPLSTIKMSLQIVGKRLAGDLSETERELNQIALEQVRAMEHVLTELLLYSRPDPLRPEWLAIDRLLEGAVRLAQREIAHYQVTVATRYQPGLPTLHGDGNQLRQAFRNLIANAAQATEGKPSGARQVEIQTHIWLAGEAPAIIVEISDNGRGIPPESLAQVFDPFYTTRAQGTGLGLPIAKRIIEQHHGRLQLQAAQPGGTRAVVMLPVGPLQETS
jgi:signal transduction histidine kinase